MSSAPTLGPGFDGLFDELRRLTESHLFEPVGRLRWWWEARVTAT
ncbi:hypothetical protein AB0H51_28735 [Streptomyces griseoluteus]